MSVENYLPAGLTGTELADFLTFFMPAYKFYVVHRLYSFGKKNAERLHAGYDIVPNEKRLYGTSLRNPKKFRTFEPFKFSNAKFFSPYKQ